VKIFTNHKAELKVKQFQHFPAMCHLGYLTQSGPWFNDRNSLRVKQCERASVFYKDRQKLHNLTALTFHFNVPKCT